MFRSKLLASSIHLGISLLIALLVAAFVFLVWYPDLYAQLSKGTRLFLLIVSIDVVLGPFLTLVVFNPAKSRRELTLDLSLIALVQLAALGYGLVTVHAARPVAMVYEINRFRIVHASDVDAAQLIKAPEAYRQLPALSRWTLAVRPFKDASESYQATMDALSGLEIGFRPEFWSPYEVNLEQVRQNAKPLTKLIERLPEHAKALSEAAQKTGIETSELLFVPISGRDNSAGTVLLSKKTLEIVGYSLVDPFQAFESQ